MEQRADLFCVFLILIFPTLWTRLENWFPSLRRFCLHTNRTKTSPPAVPQWPETSSPIIELWPLSMETEEELRNSYGPSVHPVSTPSLSPTQSVEPTHFISPA